jgi:hypothetical protein
MLRSAISAFTRVFDAPSARSRASSTRHQRVHARLRRAISAFARVFNAPSARSRASSTRYALPRGALLIRGAFARGSAEQRNRTMRSLSSGAHSRDPLASPGERCSASDMRT